MTSTLVTTILSAFVVAISHAVWDFYVRIGVFHEWALCGETSILFPGTESHSQTPLGASTKITTKNNQCSIIEYQTIEHDITIK